jgi:hypothetical protein
MNESNINSERNRWLLLSDNDLLKECSLDFYKATGKGGQKRNKTSSAVRLTHKPTAIAATSSDGRSQHDNRSDAIRKLRFKIALKIRSKIFEPIAIDTSPRNPKFHLWVAYIFDSLSMYDYDIKKSAEYLGTSSSKLLKLIARDHILWQELNCKRETLELSKMKLPR